MFLKKLGKKMLCALLCTTMVLGMAACGNGNPEESSEAPSGVNSESQSETQKESESQEPEKNEPAKNELTLQLYVLYADSTLNYWGTEAGDTITITKDGQYTLTFDFGKQASAEALAAGVTAIENLTAIYIKDKDVMDGTIAKSNLNSASIKWDKVVVDGVELTITNGELKNAIKSSGIFDTNDPINSWDGSAVEEVVWDKTNHVVSINMEKPQTVSITFTIQDLKFAE